VKISVLLPSRKRPEMLRNSISSLVNSAVRPDWDYLEVLVMYDPDDPETREAVQGFHHCVSVHPAPQRYGYSQLNTYFNLLAEISTGDWLMLWNDDAIMRTDFWDNQLLGVPEHAFVADFQTNFSPHLCCFPAVRRWTVEVVGGFSPHTCHCDTYWQDIGRSFRGGIVPVAAYVDHRRFDICGENKDATYLEGQGGYRTAEYYSARVQSLIQSDVDKIKEHIGE
jgi:hypothetical protein